MREAVVTAIEVKRERSASRHLTENFKQSGFELMVIKKHFDGQSVR